MSYDHKKVLGWIERVPFSEASLVYLTIEGQIKTPGPYRRVFIPYTPMIDPEEFEKLYQEFQQMSTWEQVNVLWRLRELMEQEMSFLCRAATARARREDDARG